MIVHITESGETSLNSTTLAVFVVLPTLLAVISCGLPPSVNQGTIQNGSTTTFGSNVTVTCDSGYTGNGEILTSECGAGKGTAGNWSIVTCAGKYNTVYATYGYSQQCDQVICHICDWSWRISDCSW